jgi:hypothetical protein
VKDSRSAQRPGATPWSNDSQEMLLLTLLLSRYPDFAEVFELAGIALQYNRGINSLRRAGCVIHNLYWPKSTNGERRSQYRLIWCPAHLAPENHPATLGPRPNLPTKSTKAEPGLSATKTQIEHSRPLSFQPGPLQKAGIDPTAVSFRLDPAPAPNTKSRSSAEAPAPVQPPLFGPQRWVDPEEGSQR